MIGFVLWALVLAALAVLEGLGVTLRGHQWPSISDMLRSATRPTVGRWIALALWLWFGWHLFIRGWTFFLRGHGAAEPAKGLGGGKTVSETMKQVVLPLSVLYAGFVAMLWRGWKLRRRANEPDAAVRDAVLAVRGSRRTFFRYTAVTMIASYAVFVVTMAAYELLVGRSAAGIATSAAVGGAFLMFAVALPLFLTAAWVRARRLARHR